LKNLGELILDILATKARMSLSIMTLFRN